MRVILGIGVLGYGLGFVAVGIARMVHVWNQMATSAVFQEALKHALLWPALLVS